MPARTLVVDDRVFLLGLGELYRRRMKVHERDELLGCARLVSEALSVPPGDGPVEGYYADDEQLTEYFQRMRALQNVSGHARPTVDPLPEFRRLVEVCSAPLFGEPRFDQKLLPTGSDPLSKALGVRLANDWTIEALTAAAHRNALDSDDFSLVGLAAIAKDALVLAALRETAVLYAHAPRAAGRIEVAHEWAVDPALAERAQRFIDTFNRLFDEDLPDAVPANAARYWGAGRDAHLSGRCVRLGYDDSSRPVRHYHWAIEQTPAGLGVRDFWSTELWTTQRFRESPHPGSE